MKLEFVREIFKKYSNIRLHESRPVEAELFHADRQTDMKKLTVNLAVLRTGINMTKRKYSRVHPTN